MNTYHFRSGAAVSQVELRSRRTPGSRLAAVAAPFRRLGQPWKSTSRWTAHPVITIHNPNGTVTVKAWTKSEVMVIADSAPATRSKWMPNKRATASTSSRASFPTRCRPTTCAPITKSRSARCRAADSRRSGRRKRRQRAGRHERRNRRRGRGSGGRRRLPDREDRRRLVPVPALRRPHRGFFDQRQFSAHRSAQLSRAGADFHRQHSLQRRVSSQRNVLA